ncbi:DUF3907 family protein [Metabacillus bambusae]|nr:DUF3907 family protein [Metabacillus bambusae]
MENTRVKSELKRVVVFLENVVEKITNYLNDITITSLENEIAGDKDYFLKLLKSVRKLVVFCEEALDACTTILRNQPFKEDVANQLLFKVYQQCIERYFHPKNDVWYEDSRSAYSSTKAIVFRKTPPPSLADLITTLEDDFQVVREELDKGVQPQF